jgi:hypothetical protein
MEPAFAIITTLCFSGRMSAFKFSLCHAAVGEPIGTKGYWRRPYLLIVSTQKIRR